MVSNGSSAFLAIPKLGPRSDRGLPGKGASEADAVRMVFPSKVRSEVVVPNVSLHGSHPSSVLKGRSGVHPESLHF